VRPEGHGPRDRQGAARRVPQGHRGPGGAADARQVRPAGDLHGHRDLHEVRAGDLRRREGPAARRARPPRHFGAGSRSRRYAS
jgi:hypothetical protein